MACLAVVRKLSEENHHKQILWEISRLPEEVQREYAIQSCKGRALGNLGEYRKAYQVLLPLREEGEQDSLWWYRMGCCYFCMDQDKEAEEAFIRAIQLGDDSEDCQKMLSAIREQERRNRELEKDAGGKGKKW